jgi:DNA-directed RNA polymerase specialized sigma24 family protein
MSGAMHPGLSLDELAARGAGGDRAAEQELCEALRVRFVPIAKRRVQDADAEDVVQEALRIVHAKYAGRERAGQVLTWSMVVLRNVIGNYYQRREKLALEEPFDERRHADRATGGEAAARQGADGECEMWGQILEAVGLLARKEPRCAVMFRRILESLDEGGTPAAVLRRAMERMRADFGEISRGALYVALHRCRANLRAILSDMGALAMPGESMKGDRDGHR